MPPSPTVACCRTSTGRCCSRSSRRRRPRLLRPEAADEAPLCFFAFGQGFLLVLLWSVWFAASVFQWRTGLAGIGYRTIAAFSVARKPTTASAQCKKKKDETHCVRRSSAPKQGTQRRFTNQEGFLALRRKQSSMSLCGSGVVGISDIRRLFFFNSTHHGRP